MSIVLYILQNCLLLLVREAGPPQKKKRKNDSSDESLSDNSGDNPGQSGGNPTDSGEFLECDVLFKRYTHPNTNRYSRKDSHSFVYTFENMYPLQ